jgi:hypothetical protein
VGLRETMNQNPKAVTYATAGIVLLALILIGWQLLSSHGSTGGPTALTGAQNFFTTDDGKTWFPDDQTNIPPYTKDGKTAYQAVIFTCDGGKTSFIGYLQRYSAVGKKMIETAATKGVPAGSALDPTNLEVKPAGNGDSPKNWLKFGTPGARKLQSVTCPGGGDAEPVSP